MWPYCTSYNILEWEEGCFRESDDRRDDGHYEGDDAKGGMSWNESGSTGRRPALTAEEDQKAEESNYELETRWIIKGNWYT
jgi:hypothetical protein